MKVIPMDKQKTEEVFPPLSKEQMELFILALEGRMGESIAKVLKSTRGYREAVFRAACVAVHCSDMWDRSPSYLVEKLGWANSTFHIWKALDYTRRARVLQYLREKNIPYMDIMEWIEQQSLHGLDADMMTNQVLVRPPRGKKKHEHE